MDSQQPIHKRQWARPELTILVRSNPEEQVLTGCKTIGGLGGNSASSTNNDCIETLFPPPVFAMCGGSPCSSTVNS